MVYIEWIKRKYNWIHVTNTEYWKWSWKFNLILSQDGITAQLHYNFFSCIFSLPALNQKQKRAPMHTPIYAMHVEEYVSSHNLGYLKPK